MTESRASRFQRRRRTGRAGAVALRGAALGLLAVTPAGAALAGWAEAAGRLAPGAAGAVLALGVFAAACIAIVEGAAWPARFYLRTIGGERRAWPRAAVPLRRLVTAEGRRVAAIWTGASLAAAVVLAAMRIGGPWWWIPAGATLVSLHLFAMYVSPALVAVWMGARPIASPVLASRLRALSRAAGVPVGGVDEIPVHEADTATAFVAGLGARRRIFLASSAVRDWSPGEIAVVVAHELGHHRRADLLRTLGLNACLSVAGLALSAVVVPRAAWPAGPGADLAALLPVAWTAGAVWIASTPIRHAQSRHHEREADAFALALTGTADAFRSVVRRLGERHLADERPSRLVRWLTYRHPPVADRLAVAEAFEARPRVSAARR